MLYVPKTMSGKGQRIGPIGGHYWHHYKCRSK